VLLRRSRGSGGADGVPLGEAPAVLREHVRVLPRAAPELPPPCQALQEAARRDIPQDAGEWRPLGSLLAPFRSRGSSVRVSVAALVGLFRRSTHCSILDLQVVGNYLPYKMLCGIFSLSSVSYYISPKFCG
jgi:hypothetical protein